MKTLLIIFIMLTSGVVAYKYKNKFKLKIKAINELESYVNYYESNMDFYREDLYKINSNYNIMQENKNAKSNIFALNNGVYALNNDYLLKILKAEEFEVISKYFIDIGKLEYDNEKVKNNAMIKYLNLKKSEFKEELKNKGEMWFKIILMMGAIVSIIVW